MSTATTKKTTKRKPIKPVGDRIIEGLKEIADALEAGESLTKRFKSRTLRTIAPPAFTAADVKAVRGEMNVSQGIFAKLLGVSDRLVQHWEQGIREVQPMAGRLLQEVQRDPKGYAARYLNAQRDR